MSSQIRILENSQIDKLKWDKVVYRSTFANYSLKSYFLDAIFPKWKALVYGDYEYIFPLTSDAKFRVKYFITPIFVPYIGICSRNQDYTEIISDFIKVIKKQSRYVDIYLDPHTSRFLKGFSFNKRKCQVLNLDAPYFEIKSNYSSNLKRNLMKAKKNQLSTIESKDVDVFIDLFKSNKGAQLKELKDTNFLALSKALNKTIENKDGFLLNCYYEKELISSAFFVIFRNRITYLKGFSNIEGRKKGAMHYILDQLISKYSHQDFIFDFGGSNTDQVARFNYSFGAKDIFYVNYKENRLPFLLKLFKS